MQTVTNDIKLVEDIALRISMDTKSIRNRLTNIENQSEKERRDAIREISQNFGLLVEHMANELNKTAINLNPTKANDTRISIQKSPSKKVKKLSRGSSSSLTDDDSTDSGESLSHRRMSRRTKRRRKLAKSRANVSSNMSSNSEDLPKRIKDEPLNISQDMDDLVNGASNSANESLTKENDLLGFDDAMLNSDPKISSPNASKSSNKCPPNESSTADLTTGEKSIPNDSNDKLVDASMNSQLEPMNVESAALSRDDDLMDNDEAEEEDDDDDDDDEISRLLDFKSIENKRATSTNASEAKLNGIVQSAKKSFKKQPKEDELAKFLEKNTDDTEKTAESDEENSEQPIQKPKYTEEQYLKDQNAKLKEQLLQSSSDSEDNMDDSDDIDDRVNGKL